MIEVLPLTLLMVSGLARPDGLDLSGRWRLSLAAELTDAYFHSLKEDRVAGRVEAGWFPSNWCRVGLEASGLWSEQELYPPGGGELEVERVEYSLGPAVALYWPADYWIRPFVGFSIGWIRGELEQASYGDAESEDEVSDDAFYWRAGLGVSAFPARWASLDLEVSFGQAVWGPAAGGPEDRLGVVAGVSIYF